MHKKPALVLLIASLLAGGAGCASPMRSLVPQAGRAEPTEIVPLPGHAEGMAFAQTPTAIFSVWADAAGTLRVSRFDGDVWSPPAIVATGVRKPRRIAILPREDGSVLACWYDLIGGIVARSDDEGRTWREGVRLRANVGRGHGALAWVDMGADVPGVAWIARKYTFILQPRVKVAYPGSPNVTIRTENLGLLRGDPKNGISASRTGDKMAIGFISHRSFSGDAFFVVLVDEAENIRLHHHDRAVATPIFSRLRPVLVAPPAEHQPGVSYAITALASRLDRSQFIARGTVPAIFVNGRSSEPLVCGTGPRDLRLHYADDDLILANVERGAVMYRISTRGEDVHEVATPGADPGSLELEWAGSLGERRYFVWRSKSSEAPVFSRVSP